MIFQVFMVYYKVERLMKRESRKSYAYDFRLYEVEKNVTLLRWIV